MINRTVRAAFLCLHTVTLFGAAEQLEGYLTPALRLPLPSGCLDEMGMPTFDEPETVFRRMHTATQKTTQQHEAETRTIHTTDAITHDTTPTTEFDMHICPTPPAPIEAIAAAVAKKRKRTSRSTIISGSLSTSDSSVSSSSEQPPKKRARNKSASRGKKFSIRCNQPGCPSIFYESDNIKLTQKLLSHLYSSKHSRELCAKIHAHIMATSEIKDGQHIIQCQECDALICRNNPSILNQHYREHLYCTQKHNGKVFEDMLAYVRENKKPCA